MKALDRPMSWSRRSVIFFRVIAGSMIVVLISFLQPAISGVEGPRGVPSVRAEISALESAIWTFTMKYGIAPPSSITLHPTREGWESDRKSRATIRQLWPQFDFGICGGMSNVPTDGFRLNGAECLVFFLGGVIDPSTGESIGFSTNVAKPFEIGGERQSSLYQFGSNSTVNSTHPSKRLVDLDGDGFREYLDCLPGQTKPYLYISSNDGQGYDPTDFDGAMREVYRQGTTPDAAPWKAKSFQIISPGADHEYGHGGVYNPQTNDLRNDPLRKAEFDNFTNFASSVLVFQPSEKAPGIGHLASYLGLLLLAGLACWTLWFSHCRGP